MPKRLTAALLAACLVLCPVLANAQALEPEPPFSVNAASVLLIEAQTGQPIFEKNADEQRPVASITKLMTILLVLEMLDSGQIALDDEVTVSKNAAGMGGSQALLDAGGVHPLEELLKTVIVASANDSSVALAEHTLGSEEKFVDAMNKRAAALSLANTHYKNVTGLPAEGQYTTARDVATLSRAVLEHPGYFKYSTIWMDQLTHNSGRVTELVNTNRLIRFYEGADGVKTGSTNEAGFCVSASAKRNGIRFIAVVLGAKSGKERFSIAQSMLDYGFDHYGFNELVQTATPYVTAIPVTNAGTTTIDLYAAEPLSLLHAKGDEVGYTTEVIAPESLLAPLVPGEEYGRLRILKAGDEIASVSLTVREEVQPSGLLVNLWKILMNWSPAAS